MTHRLVGTVGLSGILIAAGLAVSLARVEAVQGGVPPVIILNRTSLAAGETLTADITTVPPADATGPASLTMDGLGVTADGFVQKFLPVDYYCRPTGCGRCAAEERCFLNIFAIDVRTPPGRRSIPLTLTDSRGRTTRSAIEFEVLPPLDRDADGLPDAWELQYQLRTDIGVLDDGPSGDPDGDGVRNLDEFRGGTNPRGRYRRYFAEASSGDRAPGFEQCFLVAGDRAETYGTVWVTTIGDDGRRATGTSGAFNYRVSVCPVDRRQHVGDRVVAAILESDVPFVAARQVTGRDDTGHATLLPFESAGVAAPSSRWLFADGGTDGALDTFYLAYNPGSVPVEATLTLRDSSGAALVRRTRVVQPGGRTTLWLNADEPGLGRVEASAEMTATSPILVERSWRHDPPGRTVTQQFASPGTAEPSTRWFFPDVDGQARFDSAIVVANPDSRPALFEVTLLYGDRDQRPLGRMRLEPGARVTLPARQLEGLAGTRASVEIVSANGVRILADRTVSGQDARGQWRLATIGAREPGTQWTVPNVGQSFAQGANELVITNASDVPARVQLHFNASYSYSNDVMTTVEVPARRRLVYPLGTDYERFPWVAGTLRVVSQPTDRGAAEIVVESLTYQTIDDDPHGRGAGLIGGRIQ